MSGTPDPGGRPGGVLTLPTRTRLPGQVYTEKTAPVVAQFAGEKLAKTLNADGDKDSVWEQALPVLQAL